MVPKLQERMGKGEFIRGDVPTEQYDGSPIVLSSGLIFKKICHADIVDVIAENT